MTDLVKLLHWAHEHWDEPPQRMHVAGVEPESEIGAPAWADQWRRWMEGVGNWRAAYATVGIEEASVTCNHSRVRHDGEASTCPDCAGSGRVYVRRSIYRWPMRAALAKIAGVHRPAHWPPLDRVVWLLANNRWSIDAVAMLLAPQYPRMGDPSFAHGVVRQALRECARKYSPTAPWRTVPESEKSDAQRDAEAAA